MRKRAIRKDFYMEIRKTLNRFLSIFLIVALGVAFFAGIRSTNPDMRLTADRYFDDSKLMDIRVMSSWGLTKDEVEAVSQVNGVEEAEPFYSTHVVCDAEGNELVLEVMSATQKLNQLTITEGRMPENEKEALVDPNFIESSGLKIGDTFRVSSGTQEKIGDTLKEDQFTIVGIGTTSYYLSFQRGTSTIGSGDVDSFIVILPEVFHGEVYSGVNVTVQGAEALTAFTKGYDDLVEETRKKIEEIADFQAEKRYQKQYGDAKKKITEAKEEVEKARVDANRKIEDGKATLQMLPEGEQRIAAETQLLEAKEEAEQKISKAEKEIAESEDQLNKLTPPIWYVLDRSSIEAYAEYEQNADRIGAIGEVFPTIFFLVAALISLTTMTRMVEEERVQIGTLKALGYSKTAIALKYILYALLATLGGSAAGAAAGSKILPSIIITSYKILYRNLPGVIAPLNLYYSSMATLFAVFSVGLATIIACYKELRAKPADLMRPVAPKEGKRVLLERIPFLWRLFTFSWKATIRNLFRYKKRFFMTVFGIGGCMALLLVGFGLKDSIFTIYTKQFDELVLYDATVSFKEEVTENDKKDLEQVLKENSAVKSFTQVREKTVEIKLGKKEKNVSLIVPQETDKINDFIVFRSRTGDRSYELKGNEVLITEQIAKQIGAKAGDTITIKDGNQSAEAVVSAIIENYMMHYLYLSPELYNQMYNALPQYNKYYLLLDTTEKISEQEVGNALLENSSVTGVFYVSYFRNLLSNMMTSLNIVVWVLIVSAGALAFVVLYNLNNINMNERRRELATIKVLGFYNNELASYVYRENIILTIIGTIAGILLGILLHRYVIETVEVNMVMFGRVIHPVSYLYSILLTLFFSAFVNFMMMFKLKKINMVESLKSVE